MMRRGHLEHIQQSEQRGYVIAVTHDADICNIRYILHNSRKRNQGLKIPKE